MIRPVLGRFEGRGWTEDGGGQQQITSDGIRASNASDESATAVVQFIEKIP